MTQTDIIRDRLLNTDEYGESEDAIKAYDKLTAAVELTISLLQELADGGANNPELEILKAARANHDKV